MNADLKDSFRRADGRGSRRDRAALERGFPYGGLIPKGRLAEDGQVPPVFTAMEESTRKDYIYRTEWNVVHSDATLIVTNRVPLSGGTKRTANFCEKHDKPYLVAEYRPGQGIPSAN